MENKKKIAVIGAGAGGLAATKRVLEFNFECVTFEQTDSVGGTWVYTEETGQNKYGLPVHSSMYKGLRTNLPKDVMLLPGYSYNTEKSFLFSNEVLNYFDEYTDHFDFRKYIKFCHNVNEITPIEDQKWEIKVTNLKNQKQSVYYFDAVIISTGIYNNPVYPNPEIENSENFKGIPLHSHDYRDSARFRDMNVLVIGSGPSGIDIADQLTRHAKHVYFSHHNELIKDNKFPNNLSQENDVKKFKENGVVFVDGSEAEIDAVIYCTGYQYNYPFLNPKCGITIDENGTVKPLYKQFINIEHPTMCIIGIPKKCPSFALRDLQARCFLKIFNKEANLPSKSKMYEETLQEIDTRVKQNDNKLYRNYYHIIGRDRAKEYYDSISLLGNLPPVRRVEFDMYFSGLDNLRVDYLNYRNSICKVIDDEHYIMEPLTQGNKT